jgi:hypothetical protein
MPDRKTRPRLETSEVPSEEGICPYLGIEEDVRTCLAYPSSWNFCHRSQPASVVRRSHQQKTCLLSAHPACPVFQSEPAGPLPVELRAPRRNRRKASSRKA